MIARMWHGRVRAEKAGAYREFLRARAIPDYRSVEGNTGVYILERPDGDVTHFTTLTFWRDRASIEAFAGADIDTPRYYPEDREFLLEFEPRVVHWEVVGSAG